MSTDNPLVDPHSQFNPDDYAVNPNEVAHGDLSTLSPVSSGGDWWSGTGLWDDANQLAQSAKNHDLAGEISGSVAVGLDTLGVAMDPIGAALSGLAGWMIDHLKPLKLALDELAGNPETIKGVAKTWENISDHLQNTAKEYAQAVPKETSSWQGGAADGYHQSAGKLVDATGAAGSLADGMSGLVTIAGEGVAFTRSTVRDLIANLVADLVEDALEEACSIGFATPIVVAEAVGQISRVTRITMREIERMVDVINDIATIASKINGVLGEIGKILEELPQAGKAAG